MDQHYKIIIDSEGRVKGMRDTEGALIDVDQALKKTDKSGKRLGKTLKKTGESAGGLGKTLKLLAGSALAVGLVTLANRGLEFNRTLEDTQIAVASVLQKFNPDQYADFAAANIAAADAVELLKEKAAVAPGTIRQLAAGYISIAGAAAQAGINTAQTIDLTVRMSQAMSRLALDQSQLTQESRALLTGNISLDAALAKTLGITNESIRVAKEQGNLYEYLVEQIGALGEAADSNSVALSNLTDAIDQALGTVMEGAFERSTQAAKDLSAALQDPQTVAKLKDIGAAVANLADGLIWMAKAGSDVFLWVNDYMQAWGAMLGSGDLDEAAAAASDMNREVVATGAAADEAAAKLAKLKKEMADAAKMKAFREEIGEVNAGITTYAKSAKVATTETKALTGSMGTGKKKLTEFEKAMKKLDATLVSVRARLAETKAELFDLQLSGTAQAWNRLSRLEEIQARYEAINSFIEQGFASTEKIKLLDQERKQLKVEELEIRNELAEILAEQGTEEEEIARLMAEQNVSATEAYELVLKRLEAERQITDQIQNQLRGFFDQLDAQSALRNNGFEPWDDTGGSRSKDSLLAEDFFGEGSRPIGGRDPASGPRSFFGDGSSDSLFGDAFYGGSGSSGSSHSSTPGTGGVNFRFNDSLSSSLTPEMIRAINYARGDAGTANHVDTGFQNLFPGGTTQNIRLSPAAEQQIRRLVEQSGTTSAEFLAGMEAISRHNQESAAAIRIIRDQLKNTRLRP